MNVPVSMNVDDFPGVLTRSGVIIGADMPPANGILNSKKSI